MRILVTGGCGNIGKHVVEALSKKERHIRVVDKDPNALNMLKSANIETVLGDLSDRDFVFKIVREMDAIVHLAWSFSKDPVELFRTDVQGYIHLLDAAVENGIERVVNVSSAVTYGKPLYSPIDERHPRLVEQSRDPMYALAKHSTEKLSEIYAQEKNLSVNTLMIWYAYGNEIGGKLIRNMIKNAIQEGVIEAPKNSGGSFLQLDDFIRAMDLLFEKKPKGELFNLATIYLTWEQLANAIASKANPNAKVIGIEKGAWTGSSFLVDDWRFSVEKAEKTLGFQSKFTKEEAMQQLGEALEVCVEKVREEM